MVTEPAIRDGTMQVTVLLLLSAVVLIGLGSAGVGGSFLLAGLLLVVTVVAYGLRPRDTQVGRVVGVDVDRIVESLWLVPLFAALPLVAEPTATPAEMVALGGLLGLLGMANYFVRPAYLLVYGLVRPLVPTDDRAGGR